MKIFNDLAVLIYRLLLVYIVFMLCRFCFYAFNSGIIGALSPDEIPQLLRGALIFDSASIFYINIPFIFFSLLPFKIRGKSWYQRMLLWLFVVINGAGLAVNMADTFYYPFKLARIASDDLHFATNGNFWSLMWSFVIDYWYGVLIWIGFVALLWVGFVKIRYRPSNVRNHIFYYISQTVILVLGCALSIFMIRGVNLSKATFPINVSDATFYASPSKASLILSNPFTLIRTLNKTVTYPEYFSDDELDSIFTPVHTPPILHDTRFEGKPNIILIILESFASAHIKAISDRLDPDAPSYTPFLDSLIAVSYTFTNAYHNGIRSTDALPSLWSSIPSFKSPFLSLPQSVAEIESLPGMLADMGYSTAFLHGAVKQSMGFVGFGKSAGVQHFFSQEEYEAENGTSDFDGKWGIWDHKFLPFAARKLNTLPQPFFATMYTLSSHHPFHLPPGFEGRYPDGNIPIHKMLGYTDEALRKFFSDISGNDWYANTVFIITADHGSGADNEKYLSVPYNFAVPLLIYDVQGKLRGSNGRTVGHIDLKPTLLGLLGYEKPYFAFGKDLFDDSSPRYTMNYMGAFNTIGDSKVFIFDERGLTDSFTYRDSTLPEDDPKEALKWTKAFIQQYYKHLKNRNFKVE